MSNGPSTIPYVEHRYRPASVPTTPAQNLCSYWPTPTTESRVNDSHFPYHGQHTGSGRSPKRERITAPVQGLGLHVKTEPMNPGRGFSSIHPAQQYRQRQAQPNSANPPQKVASSPGPLGTPYSVHAATFAQTPTNLHTPPSAEQLARFPSVASTPFVHPQPSTMPQRRMSSQGQRPVMGPPETPSRGVIPQSPSLFPNIQFSPDLFSQQMMDPSSAPIYPQQRLFWDPATATPLQSTPQQFHTPSAFPDDFTASFTSTSTIMPQNFVTTPQEVPYDLPTIPQSMNVSFMDGSTFPAPFQTSPRLAPPQPDNPTLFLSSPARRFGGEPQNNSVNAKKPMPKLPAYHHQIQETKREKELARRKSRTFKRSRDEDLVMKSVKRALSPDKSYRPPLQRSQTHAGVQSGGRRSTIADNVSVDSTGSRSIRAGRSSPLCQVRDLTRKSSASASLRSRSSVTLAIDENGVARTIMNAVPEDEDMDIDEGDQTDQLTSEDENDDQMFYSFSGDPYSITDSHSLSALSHGDAREELRLQAQLAMGPEKLARISKAPSRIDPRLWDQDPQRTIRRARTDTLATAATDTTNGGNAQQALRAIMQDRSRSASSHASTSNSHSSMQFHSSPPMQPGQLHGFGGYKGYNASPTTITDPELDHGLTTPSTGTDAESLGSNGATRCVCNSASPDGNIMIQW
ncbi:hypothetical protein H2198_001202 [Neophaeococcomyces mojaviensis]|uniref:Uncharacterized protein n=1 Tax=Neophaeococcomyces mojaviensis TaxID=3383035 RepID=A0ACC3AHM7_9EURO|nr:hypothetical protein H2198_001202 [Knufia sp. JES_112]